MKLSLRVIIIILLGYLATISLIILCIISLALTLLHFKVGRSSADSMLVMLEYLEKSLKQNLAAALGIQLC